MEITRKEDVETIDYENYDEIDVVTVEDPQFNPCESATLEIEEAAAKAMKQANTWIGATLMPPEPAASATIVSSNAEIDDSIMKPIPPKSAASATIVSSNDEIDDSNMKPRSIPLIAFQSLIGEEGTQLWSAPKRSKEIEWDDELQAAQELATRGYASRLLEILKKENEPEQAANTTARPTIVSGYQPEPVGTPRLPPMPIGVPIYNSFRQNAIQISAINQGIGNQVYQDHRLERNPKPIDLSLNQGGASFTTTARMETETISTNSYNRPIISDVKRAFNSATNPIFGDKSAEIGQHKINTERQHIWINQNPRSLFAATTTRNKSV
ncbi:hypothetical protein QAD02_003209 [Eretmocerus hayati]|uniref:Uncharacterized protein n=1 Tax=Eretmocerus hayati TaxID=131215 RepID=A0ACC2NL17_9HYME|nr:hypothetical protein QAD02_003209 [Eretmocerus hayati]